MALQYIFRETQLKQLYHFEIGLSGGIVKVSDNSPCTAQLPGSGMTVYYMVDSLDEVSEGVHSPLPIIELP
jgi:hypothetical protein